MRSGIRILACLALVACLVMPGLAMAKKGKKNKGNGLGPGGVPALRDQVVELQIMVMGLEVRLAALEGLAIDDDGDLFTENQGDCDDTDPAVFPGAVEVANGVDDDCNGVVDDVPVTPPTPPGP
jgi:hypothetical protein